MKRKASQLLSLLICFSLVGCASSSKTEQQPDKPSTSNQTVAGQLSEEATPAETNKNEEKEAETGSIDADSSGDNGVGGEYADRGIEPGLEQQPRAETLSLVFRLAYSENEDVTSSSFDEHLAKELDTLVELAGPISLELPADYVDLYTNWRINIHGMTFKQASAPQATYGFTDCNETVYATGTVNLRSGPSTDYDKVGSLSSGQSVTRTGIGTGTADGWSRIQTADGNIVYVSSNYLSTAKPAQQQTQTAKPANSSSTTNSSTTSTATPAQSNFDDRGVGGANGIGEETKSTLYEGMTEEEIQEALAQSRRETQFRFDGQ